MGGKGRTGVVLAVGCAAVVALAGLVGALLLFQFLPGLNLGRDEEVREIRDEDYRFRIAHPGPGWRLMAREDAESVNPYALAGAMHTPTGSIGLVISEHADGVDLATIEVSVVENMMVPATPRSAPRSVSFHGMPARRLALEGAMEGLAFHFDILVFLHQGWAYQLFFSSPAATGQGSVQAERFFSAVSIEPGEVRGRDTRIRVADQRGPGWRIAGGRFESASFGFALDASEPWNLVDPFELDASDPFAEAGMMRDPDVYVFVIPETVPGTDVAAYADHVRRRASEGAVDHGEPVQHEVDGRPVIFDAFTIAGGAVPFHYRTGVLAVDDRVLQIQVSSRLPERVEEALPEALSRIRVLSAEERQALRTELESEPDPRVVVGDGWSVRSGVYRDFRNGFRWSSPTRAWRVRGGDGAVRRFEAALAAVELPEEGISGYVTVQPRLSSDPADEHGRLLEHFGVLPLEGEPDTRVQRLGAVTGLRTRTVVRDGLLEYDYELLTAPVPNGTLAMLMWCVGSGRPSARDAMGEALAALEPRPSPMPAARLEGSRWVDERFGFAFESPWPAALPREQTPPHVAAGGTIVTVADGRRFGMIFAVHSPAGNVDATVRMALETMIDRLGGSNPFASADEGPGTLGGRPAMVREVQTLSQDLALVTYASGGTVYGVLVVQPRSGATPLETVTRGFRFLDPP